MITRLKNHTVSVNSDSTCTYTHGYLDRSNTSVETAADDGYFECDSLKGSLPRHPVTGALPHHDVTTGDGVSQQKTCSKENDVEEIILSKIEKRLQVNYYSDY